MDDDMEAPDQMEHVEGTITKRKRTEDIDPDTKMKPAMKATGKPVLNTRALRSVLKGGHLTSTALKMQYILHARHSVIIHSMLIPVVLPLRCSVRCSSSAELCAALVSVLPDRTCRSCTFSHQRLYPFYQNCLPFASCIQFSDLHICTQANEAPALN